jgi:hypothetical protein
MGKALLEFSKVKEGQKHVGGKVQETKSEFKTPKGNLSGKQGAKDIPDWAQGLRPQVGESGKNFAKRLMDEKYGPGNYTEGPKTEFNRIKKWADRAFQ